jgi:hypothetical protein
MHPWEPLRVDQILSTQLSVESAPGAVRRTARIKWANLSYMLSEWNSWKDFVIGKYVDSKKEKWRPNIRLVKALIEFVKIIDRLNNIQRIRAKTQ